MKFMYMTLLKGTCICTLLVDKSRESIVKRFLFLIIACDTLLLMSLWFFFHYVNIVFFSSRQLKICNKRQVTVCRLVTQGQILSTLGRKTQSKLFFYIINLPHVCILVCNRPFHISLEFVWGTFFVREICHSLLVVLVNQESMLVHQVKTFESLATW